MQTCNVQRSTKRTKWITGNVRCSYRHLIVALAVRDSMGVLLVKVKSMLDQELD